MGLKCRYILGEIIFAYMTGRTDISYAVAELLKLSGNQSECHCVSIKRVVRYLSQELIKGIIWRRKESKITLPFGSIIPKVEMDTQIPGAINTCESMT